MLLSLQSHCVMAGSMNELDCTNSLYALEQVEDKLSAVHYVIILIFICTYSGLQRIVLSHWGVGDWRLLPLLIHIAEIV